MHPRLTPILAFAVVPLFAMQLPWPELPHRRRPPPGVEADWRAPTPAELAEIEEIVAEAEQAEPGRCEDIIHDLLNDLGRKGVRVDGAVAGRIEWLVQAE